MNINTSDRLKKLPPYLFAELDRLKKKEIARGKDIIDLGVGDPDQPTPGYIIEELKKTVDDPATNNYSMSRGMDGLRSSIAVWYEKRFSVKLDPSKEILPLIGSKEGVSNIPLAFINPGDVVLVPDPCYPPYKSGTIFAGGEVYLMPLLEKNGFLPDLESIDKAVLTQAKMMFLNYPNNPTTAVASREFFDKVIDFAAKNNIIVCHDAAYSEIYFDGYRPTSFLEAKGAKKVGVEFHSLSKTYNMTGWRIGFACGNAEIIEGLRRIKSNIDSGIFQPIQFAGIRALERRQDSAAEIRALYQQRRDILLAGLDSKGWKFFRPQATFYLWMPVLPGYNSSELSRLFLKKLEIVVTPGVGFGENGEGYIRMSLTVPTERLKEAVERIKRFS